MSTIDTLIEQGLLIRVDLGEGHEAPLVRLVYELPCLVDEYQALLDQAEDEDDAERYAGHHDAMMEKFISGAPMLKGAGLADIKPMNSNGILWEIRTATARYLGAFPCKDVFVIAKVNSKHVLDKFGYKNAMVKAIERLSGLGLQYLITREYNVVVS